MPITAKLEQFKDGPKTRTDEDWQTEAAREAWEKRAKAEVHNQAGKDSLASSAKDGIQPTQWTVAYYLGADKPDDRAPNDPTRDTGAPEKAAKLKEMAAQTQGKPVVAYVDVLREQDESRKTREAKNQTEPSGNPSDYLVDHYRLRDGKVEKLGSAQSKGLTDDLKHLVRDAASTKTGKLALVINGDGAGNRGQKSDSSKLTSNGDLSAAIKQGLSGSTHERLDLLNFDECLMGQAGALGEYKNVTKDIVASSETERVSGGRVDGQDLSKELQSLLQDPSMTGRQWGDRIVAGAEKGDNDRSGAEPGHHLIGDTGTATLANIDPTKLPALTSAIDSLGKQLQKTIADPSNKLELDRIMKSLPRLGIGQAAADDAKEQKRDLKTFAEALQKSLDSGKLSDNDGKLRAAVDAIKKAQLDAVTSYHGDRIIGKDYDKQGGLSLYLPDIEFRDTEKLLGTRTPLSKTVEIIDNMKKFAQEAGQSDEQVRGIADSTATRSRAMLRQDLTAAELEMAKPLTSALDRLQKDATSQERLRDLEVVSKVAHEMLDSQLQKKLVSHLDHAAAEKLQKESRQAELSGDPKGWRDFIVSLGWTA